MSFYRDYLEKERRNRAIWSKGNVILGYDSNVWRSDVYGNPMNYFQYGNRHSEYGWEIHHIVEVALGESDELYNLRPLHWRANARLGGLLGARLA